MNKQTASQTSSQTEEIINRHETRREAHRERIGSLQLDLPGADLSGANFQGRDLSHSNLAGAQLRKTNFQGANLTGVNLENANLQGAILERSLLDSANLHHLGRFDFSSQFTSQLERNFRYDHADFWDGRSRANVSDADLIEELNRVLEVRLSEC